MTKMSVGMLTQTNRATALCCAYAPGQFPTYHNWIICTLTVEKLKAEIGWSRRFSKAVGHFQAKFQVEGLLFTPLQCYAIYACLLNPLDVYFSNGTLLAW